MEKLNPSTAAKSQLATIFCPSCIWKLLRKTFLLPYVYFGILGILAFIVVGLIAIKAVNNHGIIPLPSALNKYECVGPITPYFLYYLHGTGHVRVESPSGVLEGIMHQNRFDWSALSPNKATFGFPLPTEITFENAVSIRIKVPDQPEITCTTKAERSSHRRSISQ